MCHNLVHGTACGLQMFSSAAVRAVSNSPAAMQNERQSQLASRDPACLLISDWIEMQTAMANWQHKHFAPNLHHMSNLFSLMHCPKPPAGITLVDACILPQVACTGSVQQSGAAAFWVKRVLSSPSVSFQVP